jgi:hypothetical protein
MRSRPISVLLVADLFVAASPANRLNAQTTPFDRRLLVDAGTMATPSSASTNKRIVCIEFGSVSTRGEKP